MKSLRNLVLVFSIVVIIACFHILPQGLQCQTYEIDTVVGHRFYSGEGGLATHVSLNYPQNVAYHPITGDLFIVDSGNHVIRKIDKLSGVITTVAGIPAVDGYSGDGGPAREAKLSNPTGIAFSPDVHCRFLEWSCEDGEKWNHYNCGWQWRCDIWRRWRSSNQYITQLSL